MGALDGKEFHDVIKALPKVRKVRFTVTSTSPLEVQLEGIPTALPAVAIAGQTPAVSDTGYAFWEPPQPPLILITA